MVPSSGSTASSVSVGATVAAVPAVTFGPLALAYEPVRRLRKKEKRAVNALGLAAMSGAVIAAFGAAICVEATCGHDSD